jgi:hypothetical protein
MKTRITRYVALSGVILTLGLTFAALAQDGGQGGQGGDRQRGGGDRPAANAFDPTQLRQTMNQRLKEALNAADEEWAVLEPRIQKVQALQADAGGGIAGAMGMARLFGRGGGRGGAAGMTALLGASGMSREMQTALQLLQEAMDNQGSPEHLIKQRLDHVRELRVKARDDLATARKDLIELLTPRQEATLFQMGLVE